MNSRLQTMVFAAAGAAALLAVLAPALAGPQTSQAPAPIVIQPITLSLQLVKGGSGANAGIIVTREAVMFIDAKMAPESARAMIEEIGKLAKGPVTGVIITHSDGDHVNGLPGFPKGLKIYAQEGAAAEMARAAEDKPDLKDYLPTDVFKDKLSITVGRRKVLLEHYGPAHTSGDTVVYVDDERTAFVGDLVFIGRDPLIHRAKKGSSSGLVANLKAILGHKPKIDTFVPGHGDMITRAEVESLIRSIETRQSRIKGLVAEGKSLEEVKKILGVDESPAGRRFPSLVEVIYQELTEKK
jgi:cyclase